MDVRPSKPSILLSVAGFEPAPPATEAGGKAVSANGKRSGTAIGFGAPRSENERAAAIQNSSLQRRKRSGALPAMMASSPVTSDGRCGLAALQTWLRRSKAFVILEAPRASRPSSSERRTASSEGISVRLRISASQPVLDVVSGRLAAGDAATSPEKVCCSSGISEDHATATGNARDAIARKRAWLQRLRLMGMERVMPKLQRSIAAIVIGRLDGMA